MSEKIINIVPVDGAKYISVKIIQINITSPNIVDLDSMGYGRVLLQIIDENGLDITKNIPFSANESENWTSDDNFYKWIIENKLQYTIQE